MTESFEAYTNRILSYVKGRNPLELQAKMPATLEFLVRGAHPEVLLKSPSAGKWSITEIVAHLADDELVGAYRIRTILSKPGTEIQAFDQAEWALRGKYKNISVADSLALFKCLRQANIQLFDLLEPNQWNYYGIHAERGVESIRDIVMYYAGHDINHLMQIEEILKTA
ncbi:DinB family protein [Dyadobacter jiangsuensis]|uniref:DinB family protein n=1 Tax=Dyadobacter jiangsuensis TaxID=1591085 RepID=A0A2P8FAZ2_9BACT|nr:DinB family protein [Dyadobacter jiangsuensis]PSL18812.1 DinB family protein [Dyadobacter jiangsuensis]